VVYKIKDDFYYRTKTCLSGLKESKLMIKLLFKKKTRFELLLFEDYKFIPFRLWLKKTKMDTEKPFDLFLSSPSVSFAALPVATPHPQNVRGSWATRWMFTKEHTLSSCLIATMFWRMRKSSCRSKTRQGSTFTTIRYLLQEYYTS